MVFTAACAMMNADGGRIYIGINNDTCQPIRGTYSGVSGDKIKMGVKNNDDYARRINEQIKYFFEDSKYVRGLMHAEETEDEDVVVIIVKPADRIVYLKGHGSEKIAFRREGASSRMMNESMIRQRKNELLKKRPEKKDVARQVLQEAIEGKKKVKIYNYKSSHSGKIEHRIVEPCAFICDGRSVWCYEAAKEEEGPMRQFKLCRMGNVECLDEPWEHEDRHCKAYVDAFDWSRAVEPTIQITIQLDPKAYNYLCETVPGSKEFITEWDDSTWLLSCMVHSLEPVVSFCRACQDSVVVYGCDELKAALDPKSVESTPVEPKSEMASEKAPEVTPDVAAEAAPEVAPEAAPEEAPAPEVHEGTLREEYVSLFGKTRSHIKKWAEDRVNKAKDFLEPFKACRMDLQSLGDEAADCELYDVGKMCGVAFGMLTDGVRKWVEVQMEHIKDVA